MDQPTSIPPEHAHLIRGSGVGFGAHLFLPSHIGARPVVAVCSSGEPTCNCCGESISAGQAALRADYCFDTGQRAAIYLHPAHCESGARHAPLPVRISA
ncbi:MAG: hypothetical protein ACR2HC_06425 [Thermoleophilaceae bacterium]